MHPQIRVRYTAHVINAAILINIMAVIETEVSNQLHSNIFRGLKKYSIHHILQRLCCIQIASLRVCGSFCFM